MVVPFAEASEPGNAVPSRYLAKCVLRSSVVVQAVYGHIRSPTSLDLVFGKETALELAVVSEDGVVQSVCEQPVFGSINDLRILPWNENLRGSQPEHHGKDFLVVLSDSGKMSFLTFSTGLHRFLPVSHTNLAPPGISCKDLGRLLAVESRGRAIAVAAFEDRVAVFPTSVAAGNKLVEKRIMFSVSSRSSVTEASSSEVIEKSGGWGTIWSMAFVDCMEEFRVGRESCLILVLLLHRIGTEACEILVLGCDTRERVINVLATYDPAASIPGHLALNIIEFPVLPGYLLLSQVGGLLLLDLRNPSNPRASSIVSGKQQGLSEKTKADDDGEGSDTLAASALLELFSGGRDSPEKSSICVWSWQPDGGDKPKLVLGMDTGELAIACVSVENSEVLEIHIQECLYKCSPCRSLIWVNGGFIAALVEMGDGQILEVVDVGLTFCSLIQSISPIIDFALVDYHDEKQDQMFACCGVGHEASIRVIRSGISVERLLSTPSMYAGVTGIWTLQMFCKDEYDSFFVISFVEETRVLSVGLNFVDISESVGLDLSSSTLTCGLIEDGWLAQVCCKEVHLCAPTKAAHPAGHIGSSPLCVPWKPQAASVSLGAVSKGTIILALSQPGVLVILKTRMTNLYAYELVQVQKCQLGAEVSCISIPQEEEFIRTLASPGLMGDSRSSGHLYGIRIGKVCVVGTHKPSVELLSIETGENLKPLAVGLVSLVNSIGTVMGGCVPENVRLAFFDRLYILCGLRNGILLRYEWPSINTCSPVTTPNKVVKPTEMSLSGPNSSIVSLDLEKWKQSGEINDRCAMHMSEVEESRPVHLHLVAVRRIGISPVSFIPLQASLRADIIALSDRPWLLQMSRNSQRIAYRSISFQPSTYGTPVRSPDCPNGVLFVADCSLHLVEMEHTKRLNVQTLPLSRTPRHVVFHPVSKMLVVMRCEHMVCDICCVDPLKGTVRCCFQLEEGEIGRCMQLWQQGTEQLLMVGTGLIDGKPIMHNGEPKSSKGRLLIFRIQSKLASGKSRSSNGDVGSVMSVEPVARTGDHEVLSAGCRPLGVGNTVAADDFSQDEHSFADSEGWQLCLISQTVLPGMILAVSPYLEQYVLASAGNNLFCLGFAHDSLQRLRRFSMTKTRFVITSIAVHLNRIAVGDCRDGVLFYSYREDNRKFEQIHCDPVQRLVADCVLVDLDTAVVTDRCGNFCILSSANVSGESTSPEHNLTTSCWYHMGETMMHIVKGSFAYRATTETMKVQSVGNLQQDLSDGSLVASTLLGSVVIFIPVTGEEYDLLEALQIRLALHPMTAPLLGNNHGHYRSQGCPPGVLQVLDGDMLGQFLELTDAQQQMILAEHTVINPEYADEPWVIKVLRRNLPIERVFRLFERVHNYLT